MKDLRTHSVEHRECLVDRLLAAVVLCCSAAIVAVPRRVVLAGVVIMPVGAVVAKVAETANE